MTRSSSPTAKAFGHVPPAVAWPGRDRLALELRLRRRRLLAVLRFARIPGHAAGHRRGHVLLRTRQPMPDVPRPGAAFLRGSAPRDWRRRSWSCVPACAGLDRAGLARPRGDAEGAAGVLREAPGPRTRWTLRSCWRSISCGVRVLPLARRERMLGAHAGCRAAWSSADDPFAGQRALVFLALVMLVGLAWCDLELVSFPGRDVRGRAMDEHFGAIGRCRAIFAATIRAGCSPPASGSALAHLARRSDRFRWSLSAVESVCGCCRGHGADALCCSLTLLYFAVADFLYIGRLAAYVLMIADRPEQRAWHGRHPEPSPPAASCGSTSSRNQLQSAVLMTDHRLQSRALPQHQARRRVPPLHCSAESEKLIRGNPIHRRPRLWRAVFATHRAPHPRTERLLRRSSLHRHARRDPQLLAGRHHSVRRAVVGLRPGRAAGRPARASARRAGARHLLRIAVHGAHARRQGARRRASASTATPKSRSQDGSRLFEGLPQDAFRLDVARRRSRRTCRRVSRWSARSPNAVAAIENPEQKMWAVQFHPEVHHTPLGTDILRNFALEHLRRQAQLDAAALHRCDHRQRAPDGGRRPRHLRALRRRGFRRRRHPGGSRPARRRQASRA